MATIGHALVGLSLAAASPDRSRRSTVGVVWPGLLVCLAYLVDLIEWVGLFFREPHSDKHFLTHSPLLVVIIALLVCLVFAFATRVRSLLPYLVILIAVSSHLLLDAWPVRRWIARAYGVADGPQLSMLVSNVSAECWAYGLIFVLSCLLPTVVHTAYAQRGRTASAVLALAAIGAACTRIGWFWVPVYLLGLIHAALLARRMFQWRLLWNLAPLAPLLVLPVTQGLAGYYTKQAIRMREAGNPVDAIALHHRVIAMASRNSVVANYIDLSRCYDALNDPARAEDALQTAIAESFDYGPHIPRFWLGRFYKNRKWQGTPFYRPLEAAKLFQEILDTCPNPEPREWAASELAQLRKRGEIP